MTILILCLILPKEALAARSRAGGGKISEFSVGDFALTVGQSLGSFFIGNYISNAISSAVAGSATQGAAAGNILSPEGISLDTTFLPEFDVGANIDFGIGMNDAVTNSITLLDAGSAAQSASAAGNILSSPVPITVPAANVGFWGSLSNMSNTRGLFDTMSRGYTSFVASSQVTRAIGAAGSYYGWEPKTTYLLSAIGSGATAGFLNPSGALGEATGKMTTETTFSTMGKGALVGAAGGLGSAGIIAAIDGDKINKGEKLSVGAQVAGMTGGIFATNLTRNIFDARTYVGKFDSYKYDEANGKFLPADTNGNLRTITPLEMGETWDDAIELPETAAIAKEWTQQGFYDKATPMDVIKEHINKARLVSVKDGKYLYYIDGDKTGSLYGLSEPEAVLLNTATLGPGDTVNMARDAYGSYASERIFLGAVSDTFNNWPLIAGNALELLVTDSMGESQRFGKAVVKSLISSVGTPLLDSLADASGLKPGYWGFDQRMGYVPVMQNQRNILIKKEKEAAERAAQDISAIDGMDQMIYLDTAGLAAPVDAHAASNFSNLHLKSMLRYGLPVALLSGAIEGGLAELVKDDNPVRSMNRSLAAVAASSIARGAVWYANDKLRAVKEEESIDTHMRNKDEKIAPRAPSTQNPQDREIIAQGIRNGYIQPYDQRRYEITEARLVYDKLDRPPVSTAVIDSLQGTDIASIDIIGKQDFDFLKLEGGKLIDQSIDGQSVDRETLYRNLNKVISEIDPQTPLIMNAEPLKAAEIKLDYAISKAISRESGKELSKVTGEDYKSYLSRNKEMEGIVSDLAALTELVTIDKETTADKGVKFAPHTSIKFATELLIYDGDGRKYRPGDSGYAERMQAIQGQRDRQEQRSSDALYTYDAQGNIAPLGRFKYNNETLKVFERAAPLPASAVILGSLAQGFTEFGWQGLAMDMPHTQNNKMSSFVWQGYTQELFSNVMSAKNKGITAVMASNAAAVGQSTASRASLMAISALPGIGDKVTLNTFADYVPIANYKGAPFSVVAMIDKGDGKFTGRFFEFPYYKLPLVLNNIYAEERVRSVREAITGEKNGNLVNIEIPNQRGPKGSRGD